MLDDPWFQIDPIGECECVSCHGPVTCPCWTPPLIMVTLDLEQDEAGKGQIFISWWKMWKNDISKNLFLLKSLKKLTLDWTLDRPDRLFTHWGNFYHQLTKFTATTNNAGPRSNIWTTKGISCISQCKTSSRGAAIRKTLASVNSLRKMRCMSQETVLVCFSIFKFKWEVLCLKNNNKLQSSVWW